MQSLYSSRFISNLKYRTPFFLISKKKILDNINEYKNLFPNSLIYYAMKANFEDGVLKAVDQTGIGFEVASMYELQHLKKIKVNPDKIIYGTAVKPEEHIIDFVNYGVNKFACDSLSELDKLRRCAPGSKIYIRINVNDEGSAFRFSEKFGTELENLVPFLVKAKSFGLVPWGVSFHVGSQAVNANLWQEALDSLLPEVQELLEKKIKIEVVNIGGGFPCNKYVASENVPKLDDISSVVKQTISRFPYPVKIVLEPGRGIVADASVLVTSVVGRVSRKFKEWLFVDVGVYTGLFETMAYQGSTKYRVTEVKDGIGKKSSIDFAIAGPTGDSPDIVTKSVSLSGDINVGDKLVVHDVGAYSLPAISPFNGFPKPNVYFVDEGEEREYTFFMNFNFYQKVVLVFFLALFAFWSVLFSFEIKSGFYNYLYSFLFGVTPFLSGLVAMKYAKMWGGLKSTIGRSVFFLGLGIFLWGTGEMIWSYYNFFLGVPAPYPSLADIGFAPSIFFYGLGAAFLSMATGANVALRNNWVKLFTFISAVVLFFVAYYLLVEIARGGVLIPPGETPIKIILDIAYPLGGYVALVLSVLISGLTFKYLGGEYKIDIYAIWLGLFVMFVADMLFSYTTTTGTYYNANFGDLLLTTGTTLLSFGVLGFCKFKIE